MTTKEFEEMFGQHFSIDVDNTFDNAIATEVVDDDEDGKCIDAVQKESSSLDLSFGSLQEEKSGDTEFDMFNESSDNLNLSFGNNQHKSLDESSNGFNLSFMKESSSEVEDDLYVGNEDFDSQFDLMTDEDDGLDVASDCGDAEYIEDDDEDGECIDLVEAE